MRKLGCLAMLLVLLAVTGEAYVAYQLMIMLGTPRDPEYLGVFLCLIGLSIAGYQLLRWRLRSLPQAMLSGTPGRAAAGAAGCVLLIIPGFITAAAGLLLQLPPVQKLFGGAMLKVLQAQMARQMAKQMGGGMGGFPGAGFPTAQTPPFPGGRFGGMQPDERLRSKTRGKKTRTKTINTTAERQD